MVVKILRKFNSRKPYYESDTDFTTNTPSYYMDLARKNKLIKVLAEKIGFYDEELAKRFEEWDLLISKFPENVENLLIEWLDNGTLQEIINVNIFRDLNNKIDSLRVEFDDHLTGDFKDLETAFNNHLINFVNFYNETNDKFTSLENDLDETNNELDNTKNDLTSFKNTTNQELNILKKSVPKDHYNSSAFNSLQEAVYAAENGVLHVDKGTYLIDEPIKIRSNTVIIAYGCIFRRNSDINIMFINDSNGSKGGYTANNNITILGGTFDGAGGSFIDECTIMAFGHASDITIEDCTFKNLVNWHMVEYNAVNNGKVLNCKFENYGSSTKGTEMLQIDIAKGSGMFPWFGPYDDTTCNNILVKGCEFVDGVRGVGTHTTSENKEHTRISIINNSFINFSKEAIFGLDWAFTKIHSNHMSNVFKGIYLDVKSRDVYNHSILDNYLSGKRNDPDSRGIQVKGTNGGNGIRAGTIRNNRVKRFGGHGIGVDFCDLWTITGNDVDTCGKAGIIIWGSTTVLVTDNVSRWNNVLGAGGSANEVDISVSATGASNVTLLGNYVETIRSSNLAKKVLISNNIVINSLINASTESKSVNNMVNGVFVE